MTHPFRRSRLARQASASALVVLGLASAGCDEDDCYVGAWYDVPFFKLASDNETYALYVDGWRAHDYADDVTAAEAHADGARFILHLDAGEERGALVDIREWIPAVTASMAVADARGVPVLWGDTPLDPREYERAFERLTAGVERSHHAWVMDGVYDVHAPERLLIREGEHAYLQLEFIAPEFEPDGFIKFPPSVAAYGRELDATCGRPRPTIE
ncbi:MAG: hypothetical protein H6713_08795 [Myxococcales bacterium]|nr:hypothetical protein [Myxococcales bacterium]